MPPFAATPQPIGDPSDLGADDTYRAGEVVTVTEDDEVWAEIVVTDVSIHTSYGHGYYPDKPHRGNVFIQAFVKYTALANGVDYNPFDWQVFADGEAVDTHAYVLEGPTPELGFGTLPKGRKASGWLVYEVPAKGEVRMSFSGTFSNEEPIFEVVIRGN